MQTAKVKAQAGVQIFLLDGFSIRHGEEFFGPDCFRLRKSQDLIKILALSPKHHLQRDQLLEWLWPSGDVETSANSLYQALYAARKVLKSLQPFLDIRFDGDFLSMVADPPLWVDVEAFEAATEQARKNQDIPHYLAAVSLYSGDLLPENRYEEWTLVKREDLLQTYLNLLQALAHLQEAQEDYQAAIVTYQRLVAHDPLMEEAHAGLMRNFALTGRRSQALHQYLFLKDLLHTKLGIVPDSETQKLYQSILAGNYQLITHET
jgi:DNA-binding SARP family transcriptional activator